VLRIVLKFDKEICFSCGVNLLDNVKLKLFLFECFIPNSLSLTTAASETTPVEIPVAEVLTVSYDTCGLGPWVVFLWMWQTKSVKTLNGSIVTVEVIPCVEQCMANHKPSKGESTQLNEHIWNCQVEIYCSLATV
jgi:hypothetical protein